MAKLKTKSAAKKRLKISGKGKIRRNKAGHGHLLSKKTGSRKRRLKNSGIVSKNDKKKIKRLLPYG